jgi:hypothetical protein
MNRLDEQTLHKVRRMAKAGASPEYIASRYALPVEQVAFVCGKLPPGEWEGYGDVPPVIGPECDDGNCPVLPFSCVHRQLAAE